MTTFDFNKVIANSSGLYLGARKIDEIGDYGLLIVLDLFFEINQFEFLRWKCISTEKICSKRI